MKTFLLTLGAIALTSSAATAADFSKFGIRMETDTYCQEINPALPWQVKKVLINACANQEVTEQKMLKALEAICRYGSSSNCAESKLKVRGLLIQSRANVMLEVSIAGRKFLLGY